MAQDCIIVLFPLLKCWTFQVLKQTCQKGSQWMGCFTWGLWKYQTTQNSLYNLVFGRDAKRPSKVPGEDEVSESKLQSWVEGKNVLGNDTQITRITEVLRGWSRKAHSRIWGNPLCTDGSQTLTTTVSSSYQNTPEPETKSETSYLILK